MHLALATAQLIFVFDVTYSHHFVFVLDSALIKVQYFSWKKVMFSLHKIGILS